VKPHEKNDKIRRRGAPPPFAISIFCKFAFCCGTHVICYIQKTGHTVKMKAVCAFKVPPDYMVLKTRTSQYEIKCSPLPPPAKIPVLIKFHPWCQMKDNMIST